jgi:hypothetical protein
MPTAGTSAEVSFDRSLTAMGAIGLEPMTPSLSSKENPSTTENPPEVTSSESDRCTNGCTSESKTKQTDTVATLAATLLALPAADRARLASLLLGQQPSSGSNPGDRS